MVKYNFYNNDTELDRAWFDSSTVVYAECDDSSDSALKTVRVVFGNNTEYQYEDVDINDWLRFKRHDSQGKAISEILRKNGYKYTKLDKCRDINLLNEEYLFLSGNGIIIKFNTDEGIVLINSQGSIIKHIDLGEYNSNMDVVKTTIRAIRETLEALGHVVKEELNV